MEIKKYVKTDRGSYTDITLSQSQAPIKTYEIVGNRSTHFSVVLYQGKNRVEADKIFDKLAQKYVLQLA
tara:strand:- start:3438 stop:3644 length:207 start_codon:yes stop_codon:yes gene_type:complete